MSDIKLKEAIQKQDEYLSFWGHLEDVPVGDETFNDLSRAVIAAFKRCHGTAFLGRLVFSWGDQKKFEHGEGGIYTEYTEQHVPAYSCNFILPRQDLQLEEMVKEWAVDEWPPKFELFTRILQRIKELDGMTISWR